MKVFPSVLVQLVTSWLVVVVLSGCAESVVVPSCDPPDASQPALVCDGASGALADAYYANERLVVDALCSRTDPRDNAACVTRAELPGPALEDCLVEALSCRPELVEGLSCLLDTQLELLACAARAVDDAGLSDCIATRARDAVECHVPAVETCSTPGT